MPGNDRDHATLGSDPVVARDWRNAVVYQIYPRSFQDSDGDGIGDLPGIARADRSHRRARRRRDLALTVLSVAVRRRRLRRLGLHGVDPRLGTVADVRALAEAAHARGIALLLDLVPCHTSIEHPWFREHPDRYVWADAPPNNWRAAFGGPAWTRDAATGRWYLHSFFPEQPDLDWRNPAVVEAMQDVIRFWLDQGADGFRLDAIDRLAKHPDLADDAPRAEPFPFPEPADVAALDRRHSSHWHPASPLRSARFARRRAMRFWSARSTARPPSSAHTSSISTRPSSSS